MSVSSREVRAAVADVSRRTADPVTLERDVAACLQRRVPADLWCAVTMDPGTGDVTGGYHAEGLPLKVMPRLLDLENGAEADVATLRTLTAAPRPVVTLDEATGGEPAASPRYRDVLEPSGVRHELRAVFRGDAGAWGAIVLMRGGRAPFSAQEVDLVQAVSATVAEGLRRATVLGDLAPDAVDGPGLVLCTVGTDISVDHCTDLARQWLDEFADEVEAGLPYAVTALVRAASRQPAGQVRRVRVRTRVGRWLTLHATRLGPSLVSVILEPARPHEIAALLTDALRLTPREREVTSLAVRGLTNAQIGGALFLSAHTVNDHLKSVFTKAGVSSRTELAAKLYFDHAVPAQRDASA